jgi:site-specific DNA recombinase
MTTVAQDRGRDLLLGWVNDQRHMTRRARRGPTAPAARGELRFAFYGRVSTENFQDHESSQAWQRGVADEVISGKGIVVAEFFDRGHSRRTAWPDRPQAAALLTALAHPDRGFDAVVVGDLSAETSSPSFCRCSPATGCSCGCPRPTDLSTRPIPLTRRW